MEINIGEEISSLRKSTQRIKQLLDKSTARQVQSKSVKKEAKDLVENYFRSKRQQFILLGLDEQSLSGLDRSVQDLLKLTQKNSLRSKYNGTIKVIRKEINGVEVSALVKPTEVVSENGLDPKERLIANTLYKLVQSAGLSYEQACIDLRANNRKSYRGVATELRESLREILDYLAPDKKVMGQPNFKCESGQTKPTKKQKVRFILTSRGKSKSISETPEDAIQVVEESVGSLTRSVYKRSSVSTHKGTTREEVTQIKGYVDVVLCELLEIGG